jgi:hypothetical protein
MLGVLARQGTAKTPAAAPVRSGSDVQDASASSPASSFAAALAARDSLLLQVSTALLPVLDSIQTGQASVDDVYEALHVLQTQYGPLLLSMGVDGSMVRDLMSLDDSHQEQQEGVTAASIQ